MKTMKKNRREVWSRKSAVISQLCLKLCANVKEMRQLKKENVLIDNERHESARRKFSKQYALKIENVLQNK